MDYLGTMVPGYRHDMDIPKEFRAETKNHISLLNIRLGGSTGCIETACLGKTSRIHPKGDRQGTCTTYNWYELLGSCIVYW